MCYISIIKLKDPKGQRILKWKKSFEITRNKLVIKEIEKKLKSYVENHKESLNKIENNFEAKYYFENLKEIQSINKLLSIIDFNKMELNNCLDKNNYCHYKNIKDYDYDLFEKLSKSQELNRYEKYYLDKKYAQLTYTCWDIGAKLKH